MRIRVLVPLTLEGVGDEPMHELLELYAQVGAKSTELSVAKITGGPSTVEQHYDEALAAGYAVMEAERAEREGCDAVLNACFGDPGLRACREAVRIPVMGTGLASMTVATTLGSAFGLVAVEENGIPLMRDLASSYGHAHRLAGIRPLGASVPEILGSSAPGEGRDTLLEQALVPARRLVEEDGADVLILGCGGLGNVGAPKWLEERLGVPVLDPNVTALKLTELLVVGGVAHSRTTYPPPRAKPRSHPG
ncbi:hypothetical protein ER308_15570 [Egibacter rhizosphaerae]|uniref:Hydrogenase expression protein HupH n=1 Tax=Egibacter rhizosphaerae TaxID=1670831 RepID=A0A411YI97_9ACTN|nr:aspartate/glutamate racemase family protein [Egibacter rhizosphaerae]QBI20849.1 hypothetical protein ER308_15570 [Egibacter rhizosphaerae]